MITVRVSREWVEVVGEGIQHRSGTLLTFAAQRGRALIARVGETEAEVRADMAALKQNGALPASFRVLLPGQDAWWDAQTAWPPRADKPAQTAPDESEILLFNPLASATWWPHAISGLVRYVLATSSSNGLRWLRWPLLRPKLTLELASDFSSVERAELLDVFEEAWGRSRVQGLADVPRLTQPPWWLLRWSAWFAFYALMFCAIRSRWPLWPTGGAILVVLLPALIARRKEEALVRTAPRRKLAGGAIAAGVWHKP